METVKLAELLRATIEQINDQGKQAEEILAQIHRNVGFAPTLLQIVMQNDIELPIRQAGVVYLKNLIMNKWLHNDENAVPGADALQNTIQEQDRELVRASIIDAIIISPDLIRSQLGVCVKHIIKTDFPERWPQLIDKISLYLQNPNINGWNGALIALYQLIKNYEYKKTDERLPLVEAMRLLLPMVYSLMLNLLNENCDESIILQKQILKIYYALTQYSLPLELITRDVFSNWMEICRQILDRIEPEPPINYDDKERLEIPGWKAKKWALHIMMRMFERYGSPKNVINDTYKKLAEWYLVTFTTGVIEVMLKILDQYRNKMYVSPRVLTNIFGYFKNGVSHSYSWKLMKPHIVGILQDIIFPIMCFSESDRELWESDPHEYIRLKFDIFEDYATLVPAAQSLLHSCCAKRKDILPKALEIIMQVITTINVENTHKDGALHMLGSIADVLLKDDKYQKQLETVFKQYVLPEFNNSQGHMRARASWLLHYFADIQFSGNTVLPEIMGLITSALLNDEELPVKVEAAIAIHRYIKSHPSSAQYIENQIKDITKTILAVMRETENEDLTNVMQKIVSTFSEQLLPLAVDICQHLVITFKQVLDSESGCRDKTITASGILNTIDELLTVMEDNIEIMANLHPIVLNVVSHVFHNNISDYYEETCALVFDLTSKTIRSEMWPILEILYQLYQNYGNEYFMDVMPSLHNYLTIDTATFLSNPNRILATIDICRIVLLETNAGEDLECHAAKLLEVIILQCKGLIDSIIPTIIEMALTKLARIVEPSDLKTMCLQIIIAALYYNPILLLSILDNMSQPNTEPIISHFIKQWFKDIDLFVGIHDRKLSVLGLCTLITLGDAKPDVLSEVHLKIIPTILKFFDGLKRAYLIRAQQDFDDEESDSEDDDIDLDDPLSTDEDEEDMMSTSYLEQLGESAGVNPVNNQFKVNAMFEGGDGECSDDDSNYDYYETQLEPYTTPLEDEEVDQPIDEYMIFRDVISMLPTHDPTWFSMLTNHLTDEQKRSIQDILTIANQKQAQYHSKRIERGGGYVFPQQTVPNSFNFSKS